MTDGASPTEGRVRGRRPPQGDPVVDRAFALLEQEPDDLALAMLLLEQHANARDPRIAETFRTPAVKDRVTEALDAELLASPLSHTMWHTTATLRAILGDHEQAKRHSERALRRNLRRAGTL